MLRRSQRLRNEEFVVMLEKGRATHSPLFIVRVFDKKDLTQTKVGAVAPQKIFKTAAKRNNLRRRVYKAVEPSISELKGGLFIGIFAKQPALLAKTDQIAADLNDLFVKAKVLR